VHWRWALLLVAGCDGVFGLTHLREPPDASGDGAPADAIDAPECMSQTLHDEDGDGLKDDCDACPTIDSTHADADHDGLPDACDPNISRSIDGDRILLASTFASSTDLSSTYDTSGSASAFVSGDAVQLPPGSVVATKQPFLPTQFVATIDSFVDAGTDALADQIQVGANGGTCSISLVGCASEANKICVQFGPPETKDVAGSDILSISVYQKPDGLHCDIETGSLGILRVETPGMFMNSVPFMKATGSATVRVSSFVVYGEK